MDDASQAIIAVKPESAGGRLDPSLANFLIRLRSSGIRRSAIVSAFEETPRRFFLPAGLRMHAYASFSLPIGCGEEATSPESIARVLSLADPAGTDRVLEIGTGTGYQTALLARICRSVVSIERWKSLSERAAVEMQRENIRNVELRHADGMTVQSDERFDLILVNAHLPKRPERLMALLKPAGRLIAVFDIAGEPLLARITNENPDPDIAPGGPLLLPPIRKGIGRVL
jgi:protein-L-isoaspartate(D-aspartate) O-methyltransferase